MLTPYSGFARSIVWGDSDIKDYERFPFRTINNAPQVFQFSTVQVSPTTEDKTSNNNNTPFLSWLLLDNIVPKGRDASGDAKDGRINLITFLPRQEPQHS
jgi:hypothetical protein